MLMSKAAYAKHRGVSRQTVYDWIAKGDVVMSGSKIDVEATEKRLQGEDTVPTDSNSLSMSASQLIQWVHANDGKYPAARNQDEARRLVEIAVNLISYDIEFLSDGDDGDYEDAVRIYFDGDDVEHIFRGFHQLENAMRFIGDYFYAECLTADLRGLGDNENIDPDGDIVTMERLIALCTPLETEEARIKRFHGESE
ncbi:MULTISPECIES: hypothetical protein [Serratia]|uniref:Uncharacterized protein n=1 Tax=Serratia quinivorans TaxID=137545 RepID=A0A380A5W5_9GAMM|nr:MULTISPECIES: hypothetical protein [Serratia]RYM57992.1 hypothetical protein BSR03_23105 [Serratia proteamaculans]CAI2022483.1 Uncharacterised protein [Serratia quinivorans]SUI73908.1 Uncharacterised protein [Serratia quinivorans]